MGRISFGAATTHLLTPRRNPNLTTMTGQETVTLQSSDSKTFELPKTAAEMSTLVKNLLEDVEEDGVVPLGNVNAKKFDMILAANYLDIKDLLELTCEKVASMIKGKTPEEIRKVFNTQNDFTPAEEDEIRKENQWAFE